VGDARARDNVDLQAVDKTAAETALTPPPAGATHVWKAHPAWRATALGVYRL
jgi:hypothetical protein